MRRERFAWWSPSTGFGSSSATPAPAARLAWLEAALSLPWSPSNSVGIRTRARAYLTSSLLSVRADPVAAQDLAGAGTRTLRKDWRRRPGVANSLRHHGAASIAAGDPERGRREIAESLLRAEACGDALGAAWCHDLLGIAAFVLGDYTEASSYLRQSAIQFESPDAPLWVCHALVDLGLVASPRGQAARRSGCLSGKALRYQRDYRFTSESADTLDGLAAIAAALGHLDLAAKLSVQPLGGGRPISRNRGSRCPTTSTSRPLASAAASASKPGLRLTSWQEAEPRTCHASCG